MKRRILLGLTGSVASVLYVKLIKELSKVGTVDVILTDKAKCFIDIVELRNALLNQPVGVGEIYTDDSEWEWGNPTRSPVQHCYVNRTKWQKDDQVLHIILRDQSAALVIAPCSANTLAKISIDFQKLNFQNPSKIHKNRNKTRLKYTHLQSL